MKKLFTILLSAATLFASAQKAEIGVGSARKEINTNRLNTTKPVKKVAKSASNSRANTEMFAIDYFASDAFIGDGLGQTNGGYVWNVNSNNPNNDNLSLKWGSVFFDTLLINLYSGTTQSGLTYLKTADATLTLDSFDLYFTHKYDAPTSIDTLKFSVFDISTAAFSGSGATQAMTYTSVWDTAIVVTSAFPPLSGSSPLSAITLPVGYTFPTGKTFGIRFDYVGDTANQLNVLAGYRENCGDSAAAIASVAKDNSVYYVNYTTSTGTNLSGINSLGIPGTACPELWMQNFAVTAYVSTPLNFTASISNDKKIACPGDIASLMAFPLGSDSLDAPTFAWTVVPATAGTFSDSTAMDPQFTVGTTSGRIYVTVTDDAGNTTTVSDTIIVRGINISIPTSPIILSCASGSTVSIPCTISGYTVGTETYRWSSGQQITTSTLTGVNTSGSYTVTVTNSAGCTATTSAVVQYPGNVNNTADFVVPANMCANHPVTFTNSSTGKTGWTAAWDYGDGQIGSTLDGNVTYTNTSNVTYNVKLTMDSVGCKFSKTKAAQVRSTCTGINDVSFEKSVSLTPNPSTGNVTIELAIADKNTTVTIFNVLGSVVKSATIEGAEKTFDLSDLANGSYIVRIQSGTKNATKKLILNK